VNEDHVRELAAIRAQLTDTHSQISAAHEAEITSLTASHAAALSDAQAEHASELGLVAEQLAAAEQKARQSAQEGGEREGVLSEMCERLKSQVKELGSELERVKAEVAEGEGKKEVEEKLKRALGEVESMRDELEGTKSVSSSWRRGFARLQYRGKVLHLVHWHLVRSTEMTWSLMFVSPPRFSR
jgi:chromosome segregation ATPase